MKSLESWDTWVTNATLSACIVMGAVKRRDRLQDDIEGGKKYLGDDRPFDYGWALPAEAKNVDETEERRSLRA